MSGRLIRLRRRDQGDVWLTDLTPEASYSFGRTITLIWVVGFRSASNACGS
jgi:hypothetical protein